MVEQFEYEQVFDMFPKCKYVKTIQDLYDSYEKQYRIFYMIKEFHEHKPFENNSEGFLKYIAIRSLFCMPMSFKPKVFKDYENTEDAMELVKLYQAAVQDYQVNYTDDINAFLAEFEDDYQNRRKKRKHVNTKNNSMRICRLNNHRFEILCGRITMLSTFLSKRVAINQVNIGNWYMFDEEKKYYKNEIKVKILDYIKTLIDLEEGE